MTLPDARSWFRKPSPSLYVVLLIVVIAAALAFKLRVRGVFACQAEYGAGYLSDCNAPAFGDYDHGALWFSLEPDASRAAAGARVLLLGNSRLQFALSGATASKWFREAGLSYYLLGMSYSETVMFTGPLLGRLEPRAQVVVINVDRFFDDRVSPPAEEILRAGGIRARYREKQVWQALHKTLCGAVPFACGGSLAIYRERSNGAWRAVGARPDRRVAVSDGKAGNVDRWPLYVDLGRRFLGELGVAPACVLLTVVPTVDTKRAEARAIADALGKPLIEPAVDGLTTFDGSHLDAASAQRWAAAFFDAAGPRIRECTGDRATAGIAATAHAGT
jgi:hypothetical protein